MSESLINFKSKPSKTLALTGIFAGLFALGNFIAIPTITSHEHVVTFICATMFGPYVAVISSVIGEIIVAPFGSNIMWLPSTLVGDVLTALIIGFGRNFALFLQKRYSMEPKKSRRVAESIFYILAVCSRYTAYLTIDALLIAGGADLGKSVLGFFFIFIGGWIYKIAWTPLCIMLVDQLRKHLNVVYYDQPDLTATIKANK